MNKMTKNKRLLNVNEPPRRGHVYAIMRTPFREWAYLYTIALAIPWVLLSFVFGDPMTPPLIKALLESREDRKRRRMDEQRKFWEAFSVKTKTSSTQPAAERRAD